MIDGCIQQEGFKCSSCKDDYELVDGTCQFKNCFDWSEDRCLICKKGFSLVGGKCVENKEKFVCPG